MERKVMRPSEHPPGYKNTKDSKTYTMKAICSNCGNRQNIKIPKGTRYISLTPTRKTCSKCGCYTLVVIV